MLIFVQWPNSLKLENASRKILRTREHQRFLNLIQGMRHHPEEPHEIPPCGDLLCQPVKRILEPYCVYIQFSHLPGINWCHHIFPLVFVFFRFKTLTLIEFLTYRNAMPTMHAPLVTPKHIIPYSNLDEMECEVYVYSKTVMLWKNFGKIFQELLSNNKYINVRWFCYFCTRLQEFSNSALDVALPISRPK